MQTTCPSCHGSGKVIRQRCPDCRGGGYVPRRVTRKVDIPAGVDNGTQLRLARRGRAESGAAARRAIATASCTWRSTPCSTAKDGT